VSLVYNPFTNKAKIETSDLSIFILYSLILIAGADSAEWASDPFEAVEPLMPHGIDTRPGLREHLEMSSPLDPNGKASSTIVSYHIGNLNGRR
jgi:hypothetical protein